MGILIKAFTRPILLTASFGLGLAMFAQPWPVVPLSQRKAAEPHPLIANLASNALFQEVSNDKRFTPLNARQLIPAGHRENHVGQGLLTGPNHLDIGPLVYLDKKSGEMRAFVKIGSGLSDSHGKVHNGVIVMLLDELLCFCGFGKLPNKRGVTAKLNVNFTKMRAETDEILVLDAKVKEFKNRKCYIDGQVTHLKDQSLVADASCLLVEPKWFKWFKWVDLF